MALYKYKNKELISIKETSFKLEKDIQDIFEQNLQQILDLKLVKSEFTIKNKDKRIDTLAFDCKTNSFVIIEFKRNKNESVIDQGFSYLSLMLQNKADFVLEYKENVDNKLKRDDVDWGQIRVIFVSQSFTENQKEAVNFKDLAVELYEVKKYEDGSILVTPIKKTSSASIKPIMQMNKDLKQVVSEVKSYVEDDLLKDKPDEIVELYNDFKDAILNLSSDIEIKPQKFYIAFKKDNNNIASIQILKKSLKIFINVKELDDSKKMAKNVSSIGHWSTGNYEVDVVNTDNIEYLMSLVKQAIR